MQSPISTVKCSQASRRAFGLEGSRIAVLWQDGSFSVPALYPAVVRKYYERSQTAFLDYANGDEEYCKLKEAAWLRLPDSDMVPCVFCASVVDLRRPRTINSGYMICCECGMLMHNFCVEDLAERSRLPVDLVACATWLCGSCIVACTRNALSGQPFLPLVDARGPTVLVSYAAPRFVEDAFNFVPGTVLASQGELRIPPTSLGVLRALRTRFARQLSHQRQHGVLQIQYGSTRCELSGRRSLSEFVPEESMLPSNGLLELGSPQCARSRRHLLERRASSSCLPQIGYDDNALRISRRKRTRGVAELEDVHFASKSSTMDFSLESAAPQPILCDTLQWGSERRGSGCIREWSTVALTGHEPTCPTTALPQQRTPAEHPPDWNFRELIEKSLSSLKMKRRRTYKSDLGSPQMGSRRRSELPLPVFREGREVTVDPPVSASICPNVYFSTTRVTPLPRLQSVSKILATVGDNDAAPLLPAPKVLSSQYSNRSGDRPHTCPFETRMVHNAEIEQHPTHPERPGTPTFGFFSPPEAQMAALQICDSSYRNGHNLRSDVEFGSRVPLCEKFAEPQSVAVMHRSVDLAPSLESLDRSSQQRVPCGASREEPSGVSRKLGAPRTLGESTPPTSVEVVQQPNRGQNGIENTIVDSDACAVPMGRASLMDDHAATNCGGAYITSYEAITTDDNSPDRPTDRLHEATANVSTSADNQVRNAVACFDSAGGLRPGSFLRLPVRSLMDTAPVPSEFVHEHQQIKGETAEEITNTQATRRRARLPSKARSPNRSEVQNRTEQKRHYAVDTSRRPRSLHPNRPVLPRLPTKEVVKRGRRASFCSFCGLSGSRPECEGVLLGPFRATKLKNLKSFYAHRNCLTWAPEVFESESSDALEGAEEAFVRARKARCVLCGDHGASLACMYRWTACCRPMHFRCALLGGAALFAFTSSFQTLCPIHAEASVVPDSQPPGREFFHVQTPVPVDLVRPDRLCAVCREDNFNPASGAILECSSCLKLVHSKCIQPELSPDGVFAVESGQGRYRCASCLQCVTCNGPVPSPDVTDEEVIRCIACKFMTIHRVCHGDQSQSTEAPFRCELCRTCRHCALHRIPQDEWDEPSTSCNNCLVLYRRGMFCPTCDKVYRDDELDMIQCDHCDRWVHMEDCCGLSEDELRQMQEDDCADYTCVVCQAEAARTKEKCKRDRSESMIEDRDSKYSFVTETVEDGETFDDKCAQQINAGTPAPDDFVEYFDVDEVVCAEAAISFNMARGAADDYYSLGSELAPSAELCRLCGSSGPRDHMRFCSDCGDCCHDFCLSDRTGRELGRWPGRLIEGPSTRITDGIAREFRPWHCDTCAVCSSCGYCARDEEVSSGEMYRCRLCEVPFHVRCISRAQLTSADLKDKSLLCQRCSSCELCGCASGRNAARGEGQGRLLCRSCESVARTGKPCSICMMRYPLSQAETLGSDARSEYSYLEAPIAARKCEQCKALVHVRCEYRFDSKNACTSNPYVCGPCRSRTSCYQRNVVENVHEDGRGACSERLFNGDDWSTSSREKDDDNSPLSSGVSAEFESCSGLTYTKGCPAGAENKLRSGSTAADELHWAAQSGADSRTCEMCGDPESSKNLKGRLLPWTAEPGTNAGLWWVHVICAVWSNGIRMHFAHPQGRPAICFLLASRKSMGALLRHGNCAACHMAGATIVCCGIGCEYRYHYSCATEAGCLLQARTRKGEELCLSNNSVDIEAISGLLMYCPLHAGDGSDLSTIADDDCSAESVTLSKHRQLDLHRPIRFAAVKCKSRIHVTSGRYRLRVGGLMVFRPGQLVPNSSLFVRDNILIPTGYRAARRHWSLKHPGRRCSYFFDVCGGARSGPVFRIRCSDDPELRISASSPEDAWAMIASAIGESRAAWKSSLDYEQMIPVRMAGAEAFGVSACRASVTMIESLPLLSFFVGRYTFKFRAQPATNNMPFSMPSLKSREMVNGTGCARSEGYVPSRHRRSGKRNTSAPTYCNVTSGEWFQLHVAMGLGEAHHEEIRGDQRLQGGACSTISISRLKGRANSGFGNADEAGRVSNAHLPHAMQYRAMLSSWQRRTVVLRSRIEGWGVFATEDIMPMEMIIEYAGEVIRPVLSDQRERLYMSEGIGCYMFEVAPGVIVDSTRAGNRARYINHSCDPNCFSRTVTLESDRKVIVIFAKRLIKRGEELCYDYQFPLDENDRVTCACGAAQCKGFMN